MGKTPRTKKEKKKELRHQPLAQQIIEENAVFSKKKQQPKKAEKESDSDVEGDEEKVKFIEKDLTQKILGNARKQLGEEMEEEDEELDEPISKSKVKFSNKTMFSDGEDEFSDEEDFEVEELEGITEEDERALATFMKPFESKPTSLADLIMERIKEKEEIIGSGNLGEELSKKLDPKIVAVYTGVGKFLSHYTSGKIPKAFKIIPSLSNWEEILYLTEPDGWTPVAVRQATRLFASNLNAKMAQRFYNSILLYRVREDIKVNKKLNFHLYLALKKALYKPAAFYKGILLPLCESGDCTLREATIIGSVLSKVSIPVLHSSAAILKIAEMDYSGANSLFLRVLLNKKYALPYRVVDAVVDHFNKFMKDTRKLPILWYQALLVFTQRYKTDLLPEQKEIIKNLLKVHLHEYYANEIRRELQNSRNRGEALQAAEMDMS